METLGAIYVVLTSLIGSALILILAGIACVDIWEEVRERHWAKKIVRDFDITKTDARP